MANKQMFVSASKFIADKREDVARAQASLRTMRAGRATLSTKVRALNALVAKATKLNKNARQYSYVYASNDSAYMDVRCTITMPNQLSLESDDIKLMVNAIRSAGYERNGSIEKTATEYSAYMEMEFRDASLLGMDMHLTLRAELAEDGTAGATCRKVQVGVETKQVPKYEIVCG